MATNKKEEPVTEATDNKKEEPTLDIAAVQAQIAAMLAEAKAAKEEAAAILAEAKAAVEPKVNGMTADERAAHEAYMNELVPIKLFKDNGKYKDDVFVSCNGETIAIKRGELVYIKRKHAEILDNSEHQDYETAMLIEKKTAEFEAAAKAHLG